MRDYKEGKIYKIVCDNTGLTYYGSTCEKRLSRRLSKHRSNYSDYLKNQENNFCTSFNILEGGNYSIVLVEHYPCNSKEELLQRERFYIENNECVNRNIPTRTNEEYYKYYRLLNAEKLKHYGKNYREENKEKLNEKKKMYCALNAEKIKQYKKNHYEKSKKLIITCECGLSLLKRNLLRHLKSKKHIDFTNNLMK